MTDTNFPLSSAGDMDDLPRTLRRERDRQKAAAAGAHASSLSAPASNYAASAAMTDDVVPAAVKRFDVPFWRLMLFLIKAVLAAIPALILLGAILWFAGDMLQKFYPELIKMKISITFPNG